MGAFVAVLGLDGDRAVVQPSAALVQSLVPSVDGHEQASGPDWWAFRSRFATLPEDRLDELAESGATLCVAHGRLDNRADLITALGSVGIGAHSSETEIIRAACGMWGSSALTRLQGDFAFFYWDSRRRVGIGATDALGVRTLRYALDTSRVVVGSRALPVAHLTRGGPRPDADFLIGHLKGRSSVWAARTPFRDVRRLPPGCSLLIEGSRVRVERYYTPAVDSRQGRTPTDWIEELGSALTGAMRSRLRSRTPVAVSLSGGVDSSVVASLAATLSHDVVRPPSIVTVSTMYPGLAATDETHYIEAVQRRHPNLRPVWINGLSGSVSFADYLKDSPWVPDEIDADVGRRVLIDRGNVASAAGCRVMLTGLWADQLLGGYSRTEQLFGLNARSWPRELPRFLAAAGGVGWFARQLASVMRNAWRLQAVHGAGRLARFRWHYVAGPHNIPIRMYFDHLFSSTGVEWRSPFLDARVIDVLLAMPVARLLSDGRTKQCLREAMSEVLPQEVFGRSGGADFTPVSKAGLHQAEAALRTRLRASPIVAMGWVKSARIEASIARYSMMPNRRDRQRVVRWLTVDDWLVKVAGRR